MNVCLFDEILNRNLLFVVPIRFPALLDGLQLRRAVQTLQRVKINIQTAGRTENPQIDAFAVRFVADAFQKINRFGVKNPAVIGVIHCKIPQTFYL